MLIYDDTKSFPVWRVEDECGCGPYMRENYDGKKGRHRHTYDIWDVLYGKTREHPSPWDDFTIDECKLLKVSPSPIFGFLTYNQILDWFGEDGLVILAKNGYSVVKKEAIKVWLSISGKQVMFVPNGV